MTAKYVLPEPVAIWTRARGLSFFSECSRLVMASNWFGKSTRCSTSPWSSGGIVVMRPRRLDGRVSSAAVKRPEPSACWAATQAWSVSAASQSARVSGRWIWKMRRLLGFGSSRLVKVVSPPFEM